MPCVIRNKSVEPLTLPYPFAGILPGGKAVIIDLTVAAVTTALGGSSFLGGIYLEEAPTGYAGPYDSFFEGDAAGGGTAIPAGRIPYGNAGGTNLTSEAALSYDADQNILNVSGDIVAGAVSAPTFVASTSVAIGGGTAFTHTLSGTPTANRVVTIPDATDTVALLATAQTFTNKTLTSPKVGTAITDTNGNEVIITPATASAINEITVTNGAAGTGPTIAASGGDTNAALNLAPKAAANINLNGGATGGVAVGVHATSKVGFYNTAPIAKQTGVAVDAAGIHAALVALGLIAA